MTFVSATDSRLHAWCRLSATPTLQSGNGVLTITAVSAGIVDINLAASIEKERTHVLITDQDGGGGKFLKHDRGNSTTTSVRVETRNNNNTLEYVAMQVVIYRLSPNTV